MTDAHAHALQDAQDRLRRAVVRHRGEPVGTVAARDGRAETLNYDQVFVRDFFPAGLALLAQGEHAVVRGFLRAVLSLQVQEAHLDCHLPGRGALPASFKASEGRLEADYGDKAIGRVVPADSVFWWVWLLRAYGRATGDDALAREAGFQAGLRRAFELCLTTQFDMYPTLLVPEGAFMIDRRMGVYGYPLEIQALFFLALRAGLELLSDDAAHRPLRAAMAARAGKLAHFVREHYWLDWERLNALYSHPGEQYGASVRNRFNVNPAAIPAWLYDWLPDEGGYLIGNLGPGRMDFRWFAQGNLLAALGGLLAPAQAAAALALVAARWEDLVGRMPLKLVYPALTGADWERLTGHDVKNAAWSYHNGGHWPVLLWVWSAACLRAGRGDWARRALESAGERLCAHGWPEYYDGRSGRLLGKQARRGQTWTMAGFLLGHALLEEPARLAWLAFDGEVEPLACSL